MNFVLDAIDDRHENRRKSQVGITARIGAAKLDPLGLWARRVHRDPTARGSVALRVGEIHWRLIAGHQPLVAVGGGIGDRQECRRVAENATQSMHRHVGKPRVARASEERVAIFPERDVGVHA